MFTLIESNAARQKWMDQSLSFNLYNKSTSLKYLNDIYMDCWEKGLKTTYYLRTIGATHVEKSTLADNKLNAVAKEQIDQSLLSEPNSCSILDPDCEACQ